MYTVSDIPAFKELILSNAALLHREGYGATILKAGATQKLDVIVSTTRDGKYVASLADVTAANVLMTSDPDDSPAFAVFKLFNQTAERVTKALSEQVPQGEDPDAPKQPHA